MRAAFGSSMHPDAPDNPNPEVKVLNRRARDPGEALTLKEHIFEIIRDIRDPEYPHSLEELGVVKLEYVDVENPPTDSPGYGTVSVQFHPTVPHCSLASMIGLSIRAKLKESEVLEPKGEHYYKLKVICIEGTHNNYRDINKQLGDKERVSAAFENPRIMRLLRECTDNLP
ncbi:MIP18 family protein FAM96A [Gracilaria domingensis]|nr:MIP18 family protein FAM96A [Gracilaria domingensis]